MNKINGVKIKEGKEYRTEKKEERKYNRRDLYRSEERRKNIIEMRLDENVKE